MKRFIKAFSLAALSAMLMIRCGNDSADNNVEVSEEKAKETSTEEGSDKVSDGETELEVLIPGYESGYLKEEFDKIIGDFEKENEGVKITVLPVGWDELNSKIVQLYQADDAPDIMLAGTRSLRQFSELGIVEPLDEYMSEEFIAPREKNVLETAKINGTQYGIPFGFSSRALFYRTDLIDTPPTTWDELYETAKKVQEENPDIKGFAIPTDITHGADELLNFIYQAGGRVVDEEGNYTLNTPENIEAFEFLAKFGEDDLIPDPVGTKRKDLPALFQNGDIAMCIYLPMNLDVFDSNEEENPYSTAMLPKGKEIAETLVTDSYTISSLSENKDIAWKFIEFAGQIEYQRQINERGWFPILTEEKEDERYQQDLIKPFNEMIQYGVPEPHVENWDLFNQAFTEAAQKVLTGQATAKEALNEAQKELTN